MGAHGRRQQLESRRTPDLGQEMEITVVAFHRMIFSLAKTIVQGIVKEKRKDRQKQSREDREYERVGRDRLSNTFTPAETGSCTERKKN